MEMGGGASYRIHLEPQQAETTSVTRTGWHGSKRNGERRSGVLVLRESVEYLVCESVTGDNNDCVVV